MRYRAPAKDLDELVARLGDADVVVAIRERVNFSRALLSRLPKLKLLALVGRNATTIDFAACTELGIPVSTGKSNSPVAPAELAIALIVASRRNIALEAERMRRGDWPCTLSHRLRGSTLGIFGLGTIGSLVAEAGHGLGMQVLVYGQQGSPSAPGRQDMRSRPARRISSPGPTWCRCMSGSSPTPAASSAADDLARMKPTALIVNTSRAELIAPGALVAALHAGRPGYAAVDVYEEEPVTGGNHPLLKMPNALCVPHLGWAEWDNFDLYFGEAFEQIVAYQDGEPLRLANPDVKPRDRRVDAAQ